MNTMQAGGLERLAGVGLEITRIGQGRPIVFFHPHAGLEGATPFLERLGAIGAVIAPSHPGFGRSEAPRGFTTVDDLAYFYLDVLEALRLENALLVGVSFGAWIALEMAIKDVSRIGALALIGAVGAKFGPREKSDIVDIFSTPRAQVEALCYHDGAHARVDLSAAPEAAIETIARNWESAARYAWTPYMHDPKLRARLHRVRRPTLMLWGAEDRIAPPAYGRQFAEAIPGARFETLARAGHFAHVDQPAEAAARIAAFMKGIA